MYNSVFMLSINRDLTEWLLPFSFHSIWLYILQACFLWICVYTCQLITSSSLLYLPCPVDFELEDLNRIQAIVVCMAEVLCDTGLLYFTSWSGALLETYGIKGVNTNKTWNTLQPLLLCAKLWKKSLLVQRQPDILCLFNRCLYTISYYL